MKTIQQVQADYYRELAIDITMQERAARQRSIRMAAELTLRLGAAIVTGAAGIAILCHAWPAFCAYQQAEQDRLDREYEGLEDAYHQQALDSLLRSHPEDTGL